MSPLNHYYGFQATPFSPAIDSAQLFQNRSFLELQARLSFSLSEQLPALVTGDVGVGKSTALRAFTHPLDRQLFPVIYLSNPQLNTPILYRQILLGLQVEPAYSFGKMLPQLRDTLTDAYRQGRCPILIVDEAHLLNDSTFEEIRLLLNFQLNDRFLLTIILVGQPELMAKVRAIEQLDQRIAIKYNLKPFNREDTIHYISYRQQKAGKSENAFSDEAVEKIYGHSQGVPRKINNLCDLSLLIGYSKNDKIINSGIVESIISDGALL